MTLEADIKQGQRVLSWEPFKTKQPRRVDWFDGRADFWSVVSGDNNKKHTLFLRVQKGRSAEETVRFRAGFSSGLQPFFEFGRVYRTSNPYPY